MLKRKRLHNLSHSVKLTCKMGYMVPVALFDVVPGDKIRHKINALLRTQPLLAPVMHAVDVELFTFFCPDRIIWDHATKFQSGGDDGLDATVAPYMNAPASTGYAVGSLADYLGLPTGVPNYQHSALPFRVYNTIYNEFFRDSQLQTAQVVSHADGADTTTNRNILAPCWKRDYFTKCRPEPQLGPDVSIPLSGDAFVKGIGFAGTVSTGAGTATRESDGTTPTYDFSSTALTADATTGTGASTRPEIYADLDQVSAVDIRDLREASAVQRFLEFNNMFGGRYIEQVWSRFKTRVPDYRLDRPEYLGSGGTKFQFSEVLATAETGSTVDVGDMKGHGISLMGSNRYRYRVPEHGWIMCILVVRPKTQYMQGLHRMWSRDTKYDYLLPEFTKIGDQAVLNKEVYVGAAIPTNVFGYTPIYEEYRTIPSRVAGDFRTTYDYWHMARKFASEPALNATFVGCNPTNRIYAATSADNLMVTMNHTIDAYRMLESTPDYRLL